MSLIDILGIDPDTFRWQDIAACGGMAPKKAGEVNMFYEGYEEDSVIAKNIDQVCFSCPVIAACAQTASQNKEEGVWGGIYWNSRGKVDEIRNRHKTKDEWAWLEKTTGLTLT
jgi:hypothetical protein